MSTAPGAPGRRHAVVRRRRLAAGVAVLLVAVVAPLVFVTGAGAQSSPATRRGVVRMVRFSPVCPVETYPPDPDCAPRPGPATISVRRADGTVAATGEAGPNGRFRIRVKAGHYLVEARPANPGPGRGCTVEPPEVTVTAGAPTTVHVSCDTGIR